MSSVPRYSDNRVIREMVRIVIQTVILYLILYYGVWSMEINVVSTCIICSRLTREEYTKILAQRSRYAGWLHDQYDKYSNTDSGIHNSRLRFQSIGIILVSYLLLLGIVTRAASLENLIIELVGVLVATITLGRSLLFIRYFNQSCKVL